MSQEEKNVVRVPVKTREEEEEAAVRTIIMGNHEASMPDPRLALVRVERYRFASKGRQTHLPTSHSLA